MRSSLRTRLVAAFVVATLVPLAATLWVAATLLQRSLGYATTTELDRLSRTLETTARQLYQLERDALRRDASDGRAPDARFAVADRESWPDDVRTFWDGGEAERVSTAGDGGNRLDLLRRSPQGVDVFRRDLAGVRLDALSDEYRRARALVDDSRSHDLQRGFTRALVLLIAAVWLLSLVPLFLIARHVSEPIRQLTDGLTDFAGGDWDRRVPAGRGDEVGRAMDAFNRMADQLRRNRDRLVYLTQMTSWQMLARKTAHELKNSLTPIRLTVEEILARQPAADRAFVEQATQIVVAEIETLERRVRAFSELAAEPTVTPALLDVNAAVEERLALLQPAHPETSYERRLDTGTPAVYASGDLVKSILTNLLENAAEAAGTGGRVRVTTRRDGDRVAVDVHDSGPGLSAEASRTLFEPTITFKKRGMGLGLSIARKHALLSGGDILVIPGELGGAGFRVTLPVAPPRESAS
jgi:nitrogen fixation/metabolism regulation signal transduction histidine kinase